MIHTKFSGYRPAGSGEDFWRAFTIYGRVGHLGHVTSIISSDCHFLVPESFLTKFASTLHSSFWENPFSFLYVHDLGPRSRNDLDLKDPLTFMKSIRCPLLPTFRYLAAILSEKIHYFHFFLWKSPSYKIWPCSKICQGQPRVIIWRNYDGLESPMLHTKFRGNRPVSSVEESVWRVFTVYVTQMTRTNFRSPYPGWLHKKIWLWSDKRFRGRRCLKLWTTTTYVRTYVRRRTTDGRRTMGIL